ncbi:MAG: hypothetical protein D4R72_06380 [Nitrosopumilales archaeon]|nr:MAG: hypothetical protein D4R72_06380 [Nitrosopumilales archaeon]
MEQSQDEMSHRKAKVGHFEFCKYPFSQKQGSRIRLHGRRIKKEKIYIYIKDLIGEGITSVTDLSKRLGKSRKQTRRYIDVMTQLGMVKLNAANGWILKENRLDYGWLARNDFAKIPEIAKWMDDCIARQIKQETMRQYLANVRYIFNKLKVSPKDIISSKKAAIEFWTRFMVEYRKENPNGATHRFRVSYRNFLASHDIIFAPKMGKVYGLSSSPDNSGMYAGVSLSSDITSEIGKMILADGDFELYVWWRVGLRTGARKGAIATMTWDRTYFDETNEDGSESFKMEQHETKDPRGHYHLGENGEWKIKYPPLDLKMILLDWKQRSGHTRFLWFKDSGSDVQNRINAKRIGKMMSKKLRFYYEKVADRIDPLTCQYMRKMPSHLMRHTLAQQMKESGMTNEEIADTFGWRTSHIVGTWYTKTSEKKRKEISTRSSKVIF